MTKLRERETKKVQLPFSLVAGIACFHCNRSATLTAFTIGGGHHAPWDWGRASIAAWRGSLKLCTRGVQSWSWGTAFLPTSPQSNEGWEEKKNTTVAPEEVGKKSEGGSAPAEYSAYSVNSSTS